MGDCHSTMTSYVAGLNPFDLESVDSPEMPQTRPDMAATSVPAHISITSSGHNVAENEDHSVLDSGEQLNATCTRDQLNVACTKGSDEDSSALDSGERVDATVTDEREPETSAATPHLTDPLVRDSGEKADVAERGNMQVCSPDTQQHCGFHQTPQGE
jgi:hypothetical protein